MRKLKTSKAQREAIARYTAKFRRVNCRFTPELYERIQETGQSANSFIIQAVEEKLNRDKDKEDMPF